MGDNILFLELERMNELLYIYIFQKQHKQGRSGKRTRFGWVRLYVDDFVVCVNSSWEDTIVQRGEVYRVHRRLDRTSLARES